MADELRHMDVETWKRQVFGDSKEGELWEYDAETVHDAVLFKDVVESCVKEVNLDRREVTIAYSAESVDRDGDIIRQKGIDLKAYRKNPVVLFAHGARWGPAEGQLPIARSMKQFRDDDGLKSFSVDRFVEADVHALGDTVFRMLASKPAFLNAASIGFLPIKVEERELEDDEKDRYWRAADFKKVEKLEHSIVPVPANADALRGAKSAGINIAPIRVWAQDILDQDEHVPLELAGSPQLTREHLERCYRIANNNRKTFQVPEIGGELDEDEEIELADDKDKGSTPGNPSGFTRADEGTAWSAPTLSAFGVTGSFEDLSASERRRIARHFAWAEQMPPTAFGQLKLPHHRASDAAVVLRGVNAALAALNGARGGVDIPSDDRQPANTHLNSHRKAFGQEPIALREMDADETRALLERFAREIAGHDTADCKECRGTRELVAMAAIDTEVGEIIASREAESKEEDVAEETKESTSTVSLGTIEIDMTVKDKVSEAAKELADGIREVVGEAAEGNTEATRPDVEFRTEPEDKAEPEANVDEPEADDVFDVDVKETEPETEPEEFDFPSIKDEATATKDDQETQVSELRQGLRDVTALVKKLVEAIKVAGAPEEPEPEKKEEGDETILVLADEPEKEEEPVEKIGRFIAEKTAEAVAGAVSRHTGRLPN